MFYIGKRSTGRPQTRWTDDEDSGKSLDSEAEFSSGMLKADGWMNGMMLYSLYKKKKYFIFDTNIFNYLL